MSYSTECAGPVNGQEIEIEAFRRIRRGLWRAFSFIPCAGTAPIQPGRFRRASGLGRTHGREITFPRLQGYRYDLPEARLEVKFTAESKLTLSARPADQDRERAIIGESWCMIYPN